MCARLGAIFGDLIYDGLFANNDYAAPSPLVS